MYNMTSEDISQSKNYIKRENKIIKICKSIKQYFVFSELELKLFESFIDEIVACGDNGYFKQCTVNRATLRNKYFFGEGYTYGSQMSEKGRGMERVYPKGSVDGIPLWISERIIEPLVDAKIVPRNFVNSVTINDYQPGGCIVSHIDPPHIFDRPIVSLSLFSDSALCFGCKFDFRPIRCTEPVLKLDLPRGIVTSLSGFAANRITHCIRPEDIRYRRAVIVLRRVHPSAPRVTLQSNFVLINSTSDNKDHGSLKVPDELSASAFMRFYNSFSKICKSSNTFGGVSKSYRSRKIFSSDSKRYSNQRYKLHDY